jgi:hypothetical protein
MRKDELTVSDEIYRVEHARATMFKWKAQLILRLSVITITQFDHHAHRDVTT